MEIGDRFFLVGRHMSKVPSVVKIAKINTKFCTTEDGSKFHLHTLERWGDHYGGTRLVPWSVDQELKYAEQIDFQRSVNAVRWVLGALGDRSNRLVFKDFVCARRAEAAAIAFYNELSDAGVLNLPEIEIK